MNELADKIEKLQEDNLNLRFDKVEKELQDLSKLLTEWIHEQKEGNKTSSELINEISKRLLVVEEKHKNCPISAYRADVKKLAVETKFIRQMFAKPIVGIVVLTIWIAFIVMILALLGPESILKIISIIK